MTTSMIAPETYFVDDVRFPFCRGCGHTNVLRRLNEAMTALKLKPKDVALVTDIGCIGLADGLFKDVHTVHTTHGRSTAFATGIGLADRVLAKGHLHIIVLIGDGGAMIGLQHLVHAAMLNANVTVLICNNFVYGMTGGQGSSLTPECFVTATTPTGNMVPPADLCQILVHSNAPYVARSLSTDKELSSTIQEAIAFPGFAAVEILELCTEFAVPQNQLTGSKLADIAALNGWELGLLVKRKESIPYDKRLVWPVEVAPSPRTPEGPSERSILGHRVSIVLGGSAGEKIQSAAAAVCRSGIASGLYATQKNDNPVTQGSGFSVAEISLGPSPIRFTGIEHPDALLAVSQEGLRELSRRGSIDSMSDSSLLVLDDSLECELPRGRSIPLPLRKTFGANGAATAALLYASRLLHVLPESAIHTIAQVRLGDKSPVLFNLPAAVPA